MWNRQTCIMEIEKTEMLLVSICHLIAPMYACLYGVRSLEFLLMQFFDVIQEVVVLIETKVYVR